MMREMERRMERLREEIAGLEEKIRMVDATDSEAKA